MSPGSAVKAAAASGAAAPRPAAWIKATPFGLYCEPGGFYIDPVQPVARAVITHGHGDHARPGHENVLATEATLAIMRARYGAAAGASLQPAGYGEAILVGREDRVRSVAKASGLDLADKGIEIHNARLSQRNSIYAQFLYERLQRKGYLFRDCQRMINQDRNYFAAAMVARGDADAIVTGVTRNFSIALEEVRRVIDDRPGHRVVGVSIVLSRGRPILVADTAISETPTAQDLVEIAIEAAGVARRLGYEPRVAMLAFSNFGHPPGERTQRVQEQLAAFAAHSIWMR